MKYLFALFSLLAVQAQTFVPVTTTNVLTCSLTNFAGPPVAYSIWWGPQEMNRRYLTQTMPVPFANFMSGASNGYYSLYIVVTSTNETTVASTNYHYYWFAPPKVPGAAVSLTTR